jgi:hypothetical protein
MWFRMSGGSRENNDRREAITPDRVREILFAYGANPQHWPANERDGVGIALGRDTDLRDAASGERLLDAQLAHAQAVSMSAEFGQRLMADFDAFAERQRAKLRVRFARATHDAKEFVWPGAPWWKPAFALSLSVFIGVTAGVFVLGPLAARDEGDQVVASLIDTPQSAYLEQDE